MKKTGPGKTKDLKVTNKKPVIDNVASRPHACDCRTMGLKRLSANLVSGFSGRVESFGLSLVLLPFAVLLVRVQAAACSANLNPTLQKYLSGDLGPVFSSRMFMRALIPIIWSLAPNHWFPEQANTLVQILAVWLGLWGCWRLASNYLSPIERLGVPLLAGIWLLWGMLPMGFSLAYPYDLPAFAFSALGMLALCRGDYYGFMLVLLAGILTKETLGWLLAAALIVELMGRERTFGWWRLAFLTVLTGATYLLPRLAITYYSVRPFAFITVDLVEDKVAQTSRVATNLRELLTLAHGSLTENVYWYSLLYLPVFFTWRHLPPELRAMWWASLVFLAGIFVCGNIWEVRIFNELIPLGALTAFLAAKHWVKSEKLSAPT